MKHVKLLLLLLLNFFSLLSIAQYKDSTLIIDLKKFIYDRSGVTLKRPFYEERSRYDVPHLYLYVSFADKVKSISERWWMGLTYSEKDALEEELKYKEKGYPTFIYRTYGASDATLTSGFIAYSKEAKAFIVFHEFVHNYISQTKLWLPYDFQEALGDVVGLYGSLEYFRSGKSSALDSAKTQLKRNEKIYSIINNCIREVNSHPEKGDVLRSACEKKIKSLLVKGNSFLKDRFNYTVNNAYLLKNSYYSQNYFLLKKVFLKLRTLKKLFEVVKNCPAGEEECKKYFKKFT